MEVWLTKWNVVVNIDPEFALANPRAIRVEVRTTTGTSALIMTRIQ